MEVEIPPLLEHVWPDRRGNSGPSGHLSIWSHLFMRWREGKNIYDLGKNWKFHFQTAFVMNEVSRIASLRQSTETDDDGFASRRNCCLSLPRRSSSLRRKRKNGPSHATQTHLRWPPPCGSHHIMVASRQATSGEPLVLPRRQNR